MRVKSFLKTDLFIARKKRSLFKTSKDYHLLVNSEEVYQWQGSRILVGRMTQRPASDEGGMFW